MKRLIRSAFSFAFVFGFLSFFLTSTTTAAAPPSVSSDSPILTSAAEQAASGSILVAGKSFTPGGRVYVAIYDVWGIDLYETRWVTASLTSHGQNGSLDPAQGYAAGGALSEDFMHLDDATIIIRAYDLATDSWSNWIDVNLSAGDQSIVSRSPKMGFTQE